MSFSGNSSKRSELLRERDHLGVVEPLVAQAQQVVLLEGFAQHLHGVRLERPRCVEAADLGLRGPGRGAGSRSRAEWLRRRTWRSSCTALRRVAEASGEFESPPATRRVVVPEHKIQASRQASCDTGPVSALTALSVSQSVSRHESPRDRAMARAVRTGRACRFRSRLHRLMSRRSRGGGVYHWSLRTKPLACRKVVCFKEVRLPAPRRTATVNRRLRAGCRTERRPAGRIGGGLAARGNEDTTTRGDRSCSETV